MVIPDKPQNSHLPLIVQTVDNSVTKFRLVAALVVQSRSKQFWQGTETEKSARDLAKERIMRQIATVSILRPSHSH